MTATKSSTEKHVIFDDPRSKGVAQVYATAYLDSTAKLPNPVDAVEELRSFVDEAVNKNPLFAEILCSAMIGREDKIALVKRVFSGHCTDTLVDFLMVLAEHERLDLLPQIAGLAEALWETRQGRVHVEVRSAHLLTEDALNKIRVGLVESLKINPILVPRVEPDLIGGLVIRVGDTVYDSSLRTQLKALDTRLRERSLNEIQSGRDRFSHSAGN